MEFPERVALELEAARHSHRNMYGPHEAYAVILEELDEFWDVVRRRDHAAMRAAMLHELVQVAAMCQRAAEDLALDRSPGRP